MSSQKKPSEGRLNEENIFFSILWRVCTCENSIPYLLPRSKLFPIAKRRPPCQCIPKRSHPFPKRLHATLDELAEVAPAWLSSHLTADYINRYAHQIENQRLPKAQTQRTALAQQIGADGLHLQQALDHPDTPPELKNLPCVQILKQAWPQYYDLSPGKATWRAGPRRFSR